MVTTIDRKAILDAANTLWALGKGKDPDVAPAVAFYLLEKAMEQVSDQKLKDLLTRAAAQLHFQAEAERLANRILADQASLAEVQKKILADQQLKYLSGDIHQAL